MRPDAEHAAARQRVGTLLVVVGEMKAERPQPDVRPDGVPELRGGLAPATGTPDAGEKNGSMLNPGVGSGMLNPTAPITRVLAGVKFAESVRAAPTCKFTATGSRLPPIRRNAAFPPTDVKLWPAPSGFQLATPSSKLTVPRPNAARPPQVWPLL
jgi:hypothetical protein